MKFILMVVVAASLAFPTLASPQEKKISEANLPTAVKKTITEQAHGAAIKGYSTEVDRGSRVYEAEMIVDGHTKDVEVASDGTLNEVEEQVSLDSLPGAVQTALHARAAGAQITKVESLTKKGTLVAYEAQTRKGSRKGEVQVGPHGEKLARNE